MAKTSGIPLFLLMVLAGCGSSIHDTSAPGPVDPGLYKDAVEENQQRLAGEDHPLKPVYLNPISVIGLGYDDLIGLPLQHLFEYLNNDTPAVAVRKMLDFSSADHRREGTLRLVEWPNSRKPSTYNIFALEADADDYTVRAAGLRALNRCRAHGYTVVFLKGLKDDEMLVRLEAADALGNIPDPNAVRDLILHMQQDPSRDVKIACAEALRNYKTAEVTNALIDVLNDKDFGVAWQARQSLALLTGEDFRYDQKAWLGYMSSGRFSG